MRSMGSKTTAARLRCMLAAVLVLTACTPAAGLAPPQSGSHGPASILYRGALRADAGAGGKRLGTGAADEDLRLHKPGRITRSRVPAWCERSSSKPG